MNIIELYKFSFYKLYCIFKSINEEGWEHWKALVVINTMGIILCSEFMIWWILITGSDIESVFSNFNISALVFIITILNYIKFLHAEKWERIIKEFADYPKQKARTFSFIIFIYVIFLVSSLVLSFYYLGKNGN